MMNKDIIYDENEFSIAVNSINSYTEFLIGVLESYIAVLNSLQTDGSFKDDLICAELSRIAEIISPLRDTIYLSTTQVTNNVNCAVKEVRENDNFVFPSNLIDSIYGLVSHFL